jgi:hypothetical protein
MTRKLEKVKRIKKKGFDLIVLLSSYREGNYFEAGYTEIDRSDIAKLDIVHICESYYVYLLFKNGGTMELKFDKEMYDKVFSAFTFNCIDEVYNQIKLDGKGFVRNEQK